MPLIIARTRDVDPTLRRLVYNGSLSSAGLPDARVLSIAQREDVVRNGLGDREGNVRKATAGMLGGWYDQAGCDVIEVGEGTYKALISFSRALTSFRAWWQRTPCLVYSLLAKRCSTRSNSMVSGA
jgi:hypothetical protein